MCLVCPTLAQNGLVQFLGGALRVSLQGVANQHVHCGHGAAKTALHCTNRRITAPFLFPRTSGARQVGAQRAHQPIFCGARIRSVGFDGDTILLFLCVLFALSKTPTQSDGIFRLGVNELKITRTRTWALVQLRPTCGRNIGSKPEGSIPANVKALVWVLQLQIPNSRFATNVHSTERNSFFAHSNHQKQPDSVAATQQPALCCPVVLWRRPNGFVWRLLLLTQM